jgi:phosphoglycerate kinase
MKKITAAGNLKGKYVLIRSSLNIPLEEGKIRNMFRLERAMPTLRYLHESGARTIILGHLGLEPEETLKPVFTELEKRLPVHWGGVVTGDEFISRKNLLADGEILLAENLRQDERETQNDAEFVEYLASLGELYINDAFAVAHREHASTFGLAQKLPAYAGLTMEEEVTELSKAITPQHPSLFLLGGAKFETKMPLVEKYLEVYDQVFIAGALMNDIFKAKGYEVVNPMTINHDHDKSWLNYMKTDIIALMECDGIFMLDNWEESKGACIEYYLAIKLGYEVIS